MLIHRSALLCLLFVLSWFAPAGLGAQPAPSCAVDVLLLKDTGHAGSYPEAREIDGQKIKTFRIGGQPQRAYGSSVPGKALLHVKTGPLSSVFELIDLQSGTADLLVTANFSVSEPLEWHWNGSFPLSNIWNSSLIPLESPFGFALVDMTAGAVFDLTAIDESIGTPTFVAPSPDGSAFLAGANGFGPYFASLGNPSWAVVYPSDIVALSAQFSPSGSSFGAWGFPGDGSIQIVVWDSATGEERFTAPGGASQWFFLDENRIVSPYLGGLWVGGLNTAPKIFGPPDAMLEPVTVSPDGGYILANRYTSTGQGTSVDWLLVDIDGNELIPLPRAGQREAEGNPPRGRWFLFGTESDTPQTGTTALFSSVDLETGDEHEFLVDRTGYSDRETLDRTADGRYAVVRLDYRDASDVWLLDLAEGDEALLGRSPGELAAQFSPNGCVVAVSDPAASSLKIHDSSSELLETLDQVEFYGWIPEMQDSATPTSG